jgi:hypothetical protein
MPRPVTRHLTVPEAARRIGISVQAAWQAVQEGRLASEAVTVPRVMVPVAAVAAYQRNATKQRAGRTRTRSRPPSPPR